MIQMEIIRERKNTRAKQTFLEKYVSFDHIKKNIRKTRSMEIFENYTGNMIMCLKIKINLKRKQNNKILRK